MRAVVRTVHDISVGPFEIESVDECLPQTPILKFLAPQIDEPTLGAGRRGVRNYGPLDTTILERRKIITRGPGSRSELLAKQIILCGETFESDLPVAVVFVTDG